MAKVDNVRTVNGKVFVIGLFVGLTIFAAVMGFGTYFLANAMTPALKKQNDARMRAMHETPTPTKAP